MKIYDFPILLKNIMVHYFHISECPDANLPPCSMGDPALGRCCLSCLTLWLGHLHQCHSCVAHLEDWPLCGSDHCLRVQQCWNLRKSLLGYIQKQNITLNGHVFSDDVDKVKLLLGMDYLGISYKPSGTLPPDKKWVGIQTAGVFQILAMVSECGGLLHALDMRIDGSELICILDSIIELEKKRA